MTLSTQNAISNLMSVHTRMYTYHGKGCGIQWKVHGCVLSGYDYMHTIPWSTSFLPFEWHDLCHLALFATSSSTFNYIQVELQLYWKLIKLSKLITFVAKASYGIILSPAPDPSTFKGHLSGSRVFCWHIMQSAQSMTLSLEDMKWLKAYKIETMTYFGPLVN